MKRARYPAMQGRHQWCPYTLRMPEDPQPHALGRLGRPAEVSLLGLSTGDSNSRLSSGDTYNRLIYEAMA